MRQSMSPTGLAFLKRVEGLRLRPYLDAVGIFTVGYGHVLLDGDYFLLSIRRGKEHQTSITMQQALYLLQRDLGPHERNLQRLLNDDRIDQAIFDMLVSLSFNIGTMGMGGVRLHKVIADKEWSKLPDVMKLYVKGGGRTIPGLVNRRQEEIDYMTRYRCELDIFER